MTSVHRRWARGGRFRPGPDLAWVQVRRAPSARAENPKRFFSLYANTRIRVADETRSGSRHSRPFRVRKEDRCSLTSMSYHVCFFHLRR
jgi:hypothetical protein